MSTQSAVNQRSLSLKAILFIVVAGLSLSLVSTSAQAAAWSTPFTAGINMDMVNGSSGCRVNGGNYKDSGPRKQYTSWLLGQGGCRALAVRYKYHPNGAPVNPVWTSWSHTSSSGTPKITTSVNISNITYYLSGHRYYS